MSVGILEAKNNLSSLIRSLEEGEVKEVVISRYGKPVARIVPYEDENPPQRIGLFAGETLVEDDDAFDAYDEEIAAMFGVL